MNMNELQSICFYGVMGETYTIIKIKDIINLTIGEKISAAGRLINFRPFGGSSFADIEDEGYKIPIIDLNIPEDVYYIRLQNSNLNQKIRVSGTLIYLDTEEKAINIKQLDYIE
jgi:lysyl-tRNA synthetase class II